MTRIDYSLFEDKYYQMDPRREDLLFDGTELQEGMIVLIDNPEFRVEIGTGVSGEQLEKAMRYNRWAMVTRPTIKGNILTFLAVYGDGSKKKLELSVNHAWLVMASSNYAPEDPKDDHTTYDAETYSYLKNAVLGKVTSVTQDESGLHISGVGGQTIVEALKEETAVGTARVEERAWATRSTPPFGGGDGDLDPMPMPKREPGAIFNELYEQKQREARDNETQI